MERHLLAIAVEEKTDIPIADVSKPDQLKLK